MSRFLRGKGCLRKNFGKLKEAVSLPDLIEVQSKSFNDFVQLDYLPSERRAIGLEKCSAIFFLSNTMIALLLSI